MNRFARLGVWQDPQVLDQLRWYYQVATNQVPANFLMSASIPVEFSSEEPSESLFGKLRDGLSTLEVRKKSVLEDKPTRAPQTSLLDLALTLVERMLVSCKFCAWECSVDRRSGSRLGVCGLGVESRVSSFFPHRGEELVFRGTHGSGTIFFTSCNLRCVFCQNGDISRDRFNGRPVTPAQLCVIMQELHKLGCHNINFVGGDPLVHLHTIFGGIHEFSTLGLNIPLLWNSNFYMGERTLDILRVVTDVWLPDLKFFSPSCSRRLAKIPNYFEVVSSRLQELFRLGESFVIRHLVLPNHNECCTRPILEWISEKIPRALVNIMGQYHPDSQTNPHSPQFQSRYIDLSRRLFNHELEEAISYAEELSINYRGVTFF